MLVPLKRRSFWEVCTQRRFGLPVLHVYWMMGLPTASEPVLSSRHFGEVPFR
jgi:hypothetical protein